MLKYKKSPGPDRIRNEMLKTGIFYLKTSICNLFNLILKSGFFPSLWCEGIIAPIHKSGDTQDPSNYRGICINSCLGNYSSPPYSITDCKIIYEITTFYIMHKLAFFQIIVHLIIYLLFVLWLINLLPIPLKANYTLASLILRKHSTRYGMMAYSINYSSTTLVENFTIL